MIGLAYKKNVSDVRESPALVLMERLDARGTQVDYHDPHVEATHAMRHYGDLNMKSVAFDAPTLAEYDAVVIATNHDWYDWSMLGDGAKLIVDTRGVMRQVSEPKARGGQA